MLVPPEVIELADGAAELVTLDVFVWAAALNGYAVPNKAVLTRSRCQQWTIGFCLSLNILRMLAEECSQRC